MILFIFFVLLVLIIVGACAYISGEISAKEEKVYQDF